MLTQENLKALFSYDLETGLFTWRVDKGSRGKAGAEAGGLHSSGYKFIRIDGRLYRCHRLAWLYVYGDWPKDQIDHINGVRSDNRIVNLREATNKQNSLNRKANANNKCGCKGVHFESFTNKWKAQISIDGKNVNLGRFADIDKAVEAYKKASRKYHGEFSGV